MGDGIEIGLPGIQENVRKINLGRMSHLASSPSSHQTQCLLHWLGSVQMPIEVNIKIATHLG